MADSKQLYQEVILDHNRKPRNWGTLADATHKAEGLNPLCGDHIHLTARVDGDVVSAVHFEGESCAICKASASMMTQEVKGKTREEAEQLFNEFHRMVTGDLDIETDDNHLGKLRIFAGVLEFPARVKCASLSWHTLDAALHGAETVSTE